MTPVAQGMVGLVRVGGTPPGAAITVDDVRPRAQRRLRQVDHLVLVEDVGPDDGDTGADDATPPFEQRLLIW